MHVVPVGRAPMRHPPSTAAIESLIDDRRELTAATRASLAYIERHYAERVQLADLAAASAQTPFQLIRAFRRELGTTPHAFLLRVRVAVAAALLAAGEPIAATAEAVGFVDQAHFTRHFKRQRGRTPARYAALTKVDAGAGRYGAAAC